MRNSGMGKVRGKGVSARPNSRGARIIIFYLISTLNGNSRNTYGFNIYLTDRLLRRRKIALPLHPVISFSVINYVVIEASPRERRSLFSFYIDLSFNFRIFAG